MVEKTFTKEKTLILKGVMILLLLFHHLFYGTDQYGPTIALFGSDYNVIQTFSMGARICVVAFLVLSGYGLYKSVGENIKKLFCGRFITLYVSYLFVVVTTLILTLFFKSDFTDLYGEPSKIKILYRLVTNLLGIQFLFGSLGISMAWWFASFLIICYLLYPILLKILKRNSWIVLGLSLFFVPLRLIEIPHIGIFGILSNLPPFILGIVLAKNDILEKLSKLFCKKWMCLSLAILFIGLKFVFYKNEVVTNYFDMCLTVIAMVYLTGDTHKWLFFGWVGKISEDVYYYHYLWVFYIDVTKALIYKTPFAFMAFITLFLMSIASHYFFNLIRRIIHLNNFTIFLQTRASKLWERLIEQEK